MKPKLTTKLFIVFVIFICGAFIVSGLDKQTTETKVKCPQQQSCCLQKTKSTSSPEVLPWENLSRRFFIQVKF